jgi:hypothetical protein
MESALKFGAKERDMETRSRVNIVLILAFDAMLYAIPGMTQDGNETGVELKPSPDVISSAQNPSPPADAKKSASIGEEVISVSTANSPGDTDSVWVQQMDVNGDGSVESANLIWDDEDKILYFYYEGGFKCKNGNTGTGAVLIGVNGRDNPRNKPSGSGFYAVSLDKDECGAEEAGLWGCRFDAAGNPTACGTAAVDDKYDDIIILTASQ